MEEEGAIQMLSVFTALNMGGEGEGFQNSLRLQCFEVLWVFCVNFVSEKKS